MQRIGEGGGEAAERDGAAGIAHFELLDALGPEPGGKIGIGENDGAGFLGDLHGIADMVAMAVGQQDMGDAVGHVP